MSFVGGAWWQLQRGLRGMHGRVPTSSKSQQETKMTKGKTAGKKYLFFPPHPIHQRERETSQTVRSDVINMDECAHQQTLPPLRLLLVGVHLHIRKKTRETKANREKKIGWDFRHGMKGGITGGRGNKESSARLSSPCDGDNSPSKKRGNEYTVVFRRWKK